MEYTNNKLTYSQRSFMNNLSRHIDSPIFFYGSVQRSDFIQGISDIDICIFTENMKTMIMKVCNYLRVEQSSFKQIIWKQKRDNKILYGYKMMYEMNENCGPIEIVLYSKKDQDYIVEDAIAKSSLPWYASLSLYVLKQLNHYTFLLPGTNYRSIKAMILSDMINKPRKIFIKMD
jgi:hypothetical protein|tara:strand:- start:5054 stop:5578 length:525 start_codon:yes stop_codon:yes gene_type:complete